MGDEPSNDKHVEQRALVKWKDPGSLARPCDSPLLYKPRYKPRRLAAFTSSVLTFLSDFKFEFGQFLARLAKKWPRSKRRDSGSKHIQKHVQDTALMQGAMGTAIKPNPYNVATFTIGLGGMITFLVWLAEKHWDIVLKWLQRVLNL